jgi:cold shock protein
LRFRVDCTQKGYKRAAASHDDRAAQYINRNVNNSIRNAMPNGTVKFFGVAKKYGFVSPDDESKDVFVPIASLAAAGISALVAGQRVSFEMLPDGKGPKAVDLKLIDAPAPTSATSWTAPRPKMEGRAE